MVVVDRRHHTSTTRTRAIMAVVIATTLYRMSWLPSSSTRSSSLVVSGLTVNRRYLLSRAVKFCGTHDSASVSCSSPLMRRCYYGSSMYYPRNKFIHSSLIKSVTKPQTLRLSSLDGDNNNANKNSQSNGNNNMTTSIVVDDVNLNEGTTDTKPTSTMLNSASMSMVLPPIEANDTTTATTSSTSTTTTTTTAGTTSTSNVDTSNICGSSILAIDPADILISIEPSWNPTVDKVNGSNNSSASSISTSAVPNDQSPSPPPPPIPSQADLLRRLPFVSMFRGSANYIANHRNTVAVYHIPGGLLCNQNHTSSSISETEMIFRDLMNDVALTWLLGIKIVIVVGCRHQIEQRLLEKQKRLQEMMRLQNNNNNNSTFGSNSSSTTTSIDAAMTKLPNNHTAHDYDVITSQHGLRVTSPEILRIVKEEAGYVRFEVERQLARSLRLQGGGTATANAASAGGSMNGNNNGMTAASSNSGGFIDNKGKLPPASMNGMSSNAFAASSTNSGANSAYFDGNVVSGNFYSAQPFGILDGVDYQYTGFVRRVEVEKIRQLHASRDICLLTTLGVSPSGEVFNVNSESLAAIVAGAMEASKVVYFTEQEVYLRHKVHGNKIQSLRLKDGFNLLNYYGIQMHSKGFVTMSSGVEESERRKELSPAQMDMLLKIGWCTGAIGLGVKRAHIITPQHGALLQELYTRDGSGTLISADLYEGIRRATVLDVSAIHAIIAPLIAAGTLIDRPKAQLEKDIDQYYIYTRDKDIIACGQLKKFENGFAEIGCLVVNKDFRSRGRGDAMLGYLERLSLLNNCTNIFVLSTQTMEWFVERGFDEAVVAQLPPTRQATYNHKRASKIYIKKIESDRDLDASELWWNR